MNLIKKSIRTMLVIAILTLALLPGIVRAAGPFVAADCSPEVDAVTGYQVQVNGGAWSSIPAVSTCVGSTQTVTCTGAGRTPCYDLASLPAGPYTIKMRAVNVWEVSADSLPLTGARTAPTSPLLKLVK